MILLFRKHRHPGREREVDPGAHLEPHRPLPARSLKLPAKEAHARLAKGKELRVVQGCIKVLIFPPPPPIWEAF